MIYMIVAGVMAANAACPIIMAEQIAVEVVRVAEFHAAIQEPGPGLSVRGWASLILAVMEIESEFNPYAVSACGARGLMQIRPEIWKIKVREAHDIRFSIEKGSLILRGYILEKGSVAMGLRGYHGGEGYNYINRVTKKRARWEGLLSD